MADVRPVRRLPVRPLSPHLSIYRFTWTMAMSIAHRITGVALYFAAPLLVLYLGAIVSGPKAFDLVHGLLASWLGILVLVGLSWALFHHAIGGVRHIWWDTGASLNRKSRYLWAQGTLIGSIALTAILWLVVFLGG